MKISWGTAMVIAIVAFISFIMYFVITMSTDKKYSHDLVTEEYYKKELEFQDQMDRELNSRNLSGTVMVEKSAEGLQIIFPEKLPFSNIKGTVLLYRPSNKQLDFRIPITLSTSTFNIPKEKLLEGRWNIQVNWQYGHEHYFFQKEIFY